VRDESICLIYLDPPFNSNASYNVLFKAPTGEHSQSQIDAFEDTVRLAMPEIGLFDAIYSARALRRLKPDPVPEEIITRILDAAIRAPSAGNTQNWAFIVVRDGEQRRRLGMIYRKASDIASEMYKARGRTAHMTEEQYRRLMTSGAYLWDRMGEAGTCWPTG
jgi:hypothetical protein